MNEKPSRFLPSLWSENPFADFRKEMDQALASFFGNRAFPVDTAENNGFNAFLAPSIDVVENDNAITMTAELPGLSDEDIDLSVDDGILTLKGEKKMEKKDDKDNYHVVERRYGTFQRLMRLPSSVDEAGVAAKFDKGVLTVTMPKKPGTATTGVRKIAIEK